MKNCTPSVCENAWERKLVSKKAVCNLEGIDSFIEGENGTWNFVVKSFSSFFYYIYNGSVVSPFSGLQFLFLFIYLKFLKGVFNFSGFVDLKLDYPML